MKGDPSHHTYIPGRTLSDGRIVLCAGAAQGVRVGAIYGIYPGNVAKHVEKLGTLEVEALDDNDSDRIATFRENRKFCVPSFFYAVEEDHYCRPLGIFVSKTNVDDPLAKLSGWIHENEDKAAMTVKVGDNKLSLKWNGFVDDPKLDQTSFDVELDLHQEDSIQRAIRRGARFHHLVGLPPPTRSSISSGLKIRFISTSAPDENILDNDAFDELKTIKLDVKRGEILGPYLLTIVNTNSFPVWPYVFFCDPDCTGFMIRILLYFLLFAVSLTWS